MWTESQGDRSVFHRKLEARLRRDGRLSPATNTAEIARILGERGIDAPLP
jgi:hypothetical protein